MAKDITGTPIRAMVRQAVRALGGRARNAQIKHWVAVHYPGTNPCSVDNTIQMATVNRSSRVQMSENFEPRNANDSRYDFLYQVSRGLVELYNPRRHGAWTIVRGSDGELTVCREGR